MQEFLPAALEADFRRFERLEALRGSAGDQARALGDVKKAVGIRNQFQAHGSPGSNTVVRSASPAPRRMLMRTPRRDAATSWTRKDGQ